MKQSETDIIFNNKNKLAVDVYHPEQPNGKVLIFWHGGGWFRGNKSDVVTIGQTAAKSGFLTFIPNYRLAPEFHFPAAHEDVETFIKWLLASDYPATPTNIMQIGASVGGTMAINASMKYEFPTVTWSAPTNFSLWIAAHPNVKASANAADELGLTDPDEIHQAFYKYFVSIYAGTDIEALQQLDTHAAFSNKIGKLLMFNSAKELVPLDSVLDFVSLIANENLPIDLHILAGSGHAMDYADSVLGKSLQYLLDL